MPLKPTSFRLDAATLAKLKALRREHEPLASVIARAVDALDAAEGAPVTGATLTAILARLDALEARMDEQRINEKSASRQRP